MQSLQFRSKLDRILQISNVKLQGLSCVINCEWDSDI